MNIPNTGRKKALLVVDVQPAFMRDHNRYILQNITTLLENVQYDAYAEAVFHAEEDSLWKVQQEWISPQNDKTHTEPEIEEPLSRHDPLKILKSSRSMFKGDQDLEAFLRSNNIEEVHLVGTETNDCVFATALDAFDRGFLPYIIEECCQSATPGRHEKGVELLRMQGMTNNRCLADVVSI